jgi:lysozyme family protein
MAKTTYPEAIRRLLASEGGYVNHPSDPGGPSNFGITIHDYRKYVKADANPADIRRMTVDEATEIYRSKYWGALRADELPAGVDYCLFDYAVNSGTARAPKVLQRLLSVPVTGRVDEATLAAVRASESRKLVQEICAERMRFLQSLRTWPVFGAGWSRRVSEVRGAALALADRAAGRGAIPADRPATRSSGKAVVPINDTARKVTTGGAVATGTVVAQQSAANGADGFVVMLIVIATLLVAAAAWAFWRWHQKRRQEAPA